MSAGYYRFPTICDETLVFLCEDDLWTVPVKGGIARRLTSNLGESSRPMLSPDGQWIAFTGKEEGDTEVYLMPAVGGKATRLTYNGGILGGLVAGWSRDGKSIIYASDRGQPFKRILNLWSISPDGGDSTLLPYGPARNITFGANGGVVIGRNTADPARWKRYKGGTAGDLWIDAEGSGEFKRLISLRGNMSNPMWIGERIYFLADHEGIGNLYSCLPSGDDLKRHTNHEEYYVRNPTTDGKRIVYHSGADLYLYDPATDTETEIPVEFYSPQVQRNRKFVSAAKYLEDYGLHPEGHSAVITARGKAFTMGLWEGAVNQYGERDGVRYRLSAWTSDGKALIVVSDADGEEAFELHPLDKTGTVKRFGDLDIGRPLNVYVSPRHDRCQVVFPNHRQELMFLDLEQGNLRRLDHSKYGRIRGVFWSPDGEWVAYGFQTSDATSCIKLCRIETGETYEVTKPDFGDYSPSFDPEGKYLYFLSGRIYNPVYDNIYFDLNFPKGDRPYLITLRKDLKSPFIPDLKAPGRPPMGDLEELMKARQEKETDDDSPEEKDEKEEIKPVQIDLEGIQERVVPFPVPEGLYGRIVGIKGKVLFTSFQPRGSLDQEMDREEHAAQGSLEMYDFETQKHETVATGVTNFKVCRDRKTVIYRTGGRLRVFKAGDKLLNKMEDEPSRESGWLDLSRIRISVDPPAEWKQMYREAWRLQREHFWTPDMAGIDWERIYKRYLPLIDRLCTRSEVSDLMWEMQGELGTSHCYEFGGDYRRPPSYRLGQLGADIVYDAEQHGWKITHIVQGDTWAEGWGSPLMAPGLNIKEGDVILAVGGYPVSERIHPNALLVNQAGAEVTLTLADAESDTGQRTVTVKTLSEETRARYREWVEANRAYVHEKTGGKVGYVHIPNMGPWGYSEFHRYYHVEVEREALIVDVRFNGGGHVSQLILQKLAQKRVGYDLTRWGQPQPYPAYSVLGPIVALTNEHAGSDGDIFSHCFKLMELGTLIGKRTWGGVIGIWPRHALIDGTVTTQPEFSFWFKDVGWGVENYGTDPDIDVDITPQDYVAGRDVQLDKSIEVVLQQLKENPPVVPDFDNKPNLALPKLPK
ncbi:MAG: peptidase [Gemmatimonadetes bacterium]|nr:MAG: peptidase [Gemmatimonadota bacterium]